MWECDKKARCINCHGSHPANHRGCLVYVIYAKAAMRRMRRMNRIVASIPDARIEEVSIEPPIRATDVLPDAAEKPTFAAVVGAPLYRKIVKGTDQGEQLIPLVASQTKRALPAPPTRAKPKSPVTSKVLQSKPALAASFSRVLELVDRIWTFVRPSGPCSTD